MTTDAERLDWLMDLAFPDPENEDVFKAKSERLIVQGAILKTTGREGIDAAMTMPQAEVNVYIQRWRAQCNCPACTVKRLLAEAMGSDDEAPN
jgi:hypothetical protein